MWQGRVSYKIPYFGWDLDFVISSLHSTEPSAWKLKVTRFNKCSRGQSCLHCPNYLHAFLRIRAFLYPCFEGNVFHFIQNFLVVFRWRKARLSCYQYQLSIQLNCTNHIYFPILLKDTINISAMLHQLQASPHRHIGMKSCGWQRTRGEWEDCPAGLPKLQKPTSVCQN